MFKHPKTINQSWHIERYGRPYFIDINLREIVIGEGNPPDDVGMAVSNEKFLAGDWHEHIRVNFGEGVLKEVIEVVHQMPGTEEYQEFHGKLQRMLQFLQSIPFDDG